MSTLISDAPDVVARAGQAPAAGQPNVGSWERLVSVGAGAGLLASAVARRDRWALVAVPIAGGLLYRGLTGRCSLNRALGKNSVGSNEQTAVKAQQGVRVDTTVVIEKPPAAVYQFWRTLTNLPTVIDHLESVTEDGIVTHWVAVTPFGTRIEWDAEFIEDRPNELIAWRSLPEAEMDTAGSLRITELPHDRGTAARLVMKYDPPGGTLAASIASWLGTDVEEELIEGLRRMKQILETGEVATVTGQPRGSCRG
jgi:uncharacterized membrane protein